MNSSRPELRVDWCSYEAAKYAVMHWHYSKRMPMGKLVKIGAWEDGRFIGCMLFSCGSSKELGVAFGLALPEVAELARVALSGHVCKTTQVIGRGLRMLAQQSPGVRLVISFADPIEGHLGTVYQASNWIYCGRGSADSRVRRYRSPNGSIKHWRSMAQWLVARGLSGTEAGAIKAGFKPLPRAAKYKYLYPLDRAMRRQIAPLAQPYPKRERASEAKETARSVSNGETGGASPTRTLLNDNDLTKLG